MIDPSSCLSTDLGPLGPRIETLVREYEGLWRDASPRPHPLGRTFPAGEKRVVEKELTALVGRVSAARKEGLETAVSGPDPDRLEALASDLLPFLKRILGLADLPLESVYDRRFVEATKRFLDAARGFDPGLGLECVYQALRNVWIMNTLQSALGLEVVHTDAIFGYSMIYPYLDNFLDDPGIPEDGKLATILRLKAWLEGVPGPADDPLQGKLKALIGLIENQYPRRDFPGVYRSMLAIHNAQVRSLLQQRRTGPPGEADILRISLEKGGTSVLADGTLVAGQLGPEAEDFCFGFGTFLQLADDLQDMEEDVRRGHQTLFSRAAGREALDPLLYKFGRYMTATLERTRIPAGPFGRPVAEIIRRGCALMALESAGKHGRWFSRACVRSCEESFPVRYSYLAKLRKNLADRFPADRTVVGDLDPVLTAFMAVSSRAFALD